MIHTSLLLALAAQLGGDEADYYVVDYLTPPGGELLEVGGMDFLPDGRLVVSTRRGQVWLIEEPLAEDPAAARFSLFAEGLWEGLGLTVVDGEIHIVQRGELSRLRDIDGDGRCDDIETLCDGWGLSGNYHEFAYGLPVDSEGHFFVSLNVSFFSPKWWHGKSPEPWRGWILRIAPDGSIEPWASGLRSPCGLGWSASGELLATDNQGDWMPASPLFVIEKGGFYGHPASLEWTDEYRASQTLASDTIPPARASTDRKPAAIWLPYKWSRSPGNVVVDRTGGRFGPFEDQLFIAELTNGMVLRGDLETIEGVRQGWVIPFRHAVGSSVRLDFAEDGTLFAGFTNRGWGGLAPADGIGRLRWTGTVPFEIADIELVETGFRVSFTAPVGEVPEAAASVVQYDYDYWWEYGSPERALEDVPVTALRWAADRRSVHIDVPKLREAKVARVVLGGIVDTDSRSLLHTEFAYTVNRLPGREPSGEHVAKVVPPPPARQQDDEGWLRLTYGDATDAWTFEGWELCDAEIDPEDPTRFATKKGVNALTNTASDTPSDYVSKALFGDGTYELSFMLPQGGEASVWIHGRYGLRLTDSRAEAGKPLTSEHCGSIMGNDERPSLPPGAHPYIGHGQWHDLTIEFRAARFDEAGKLLAPAEFVRVAMDDVTIHDNVQLAGPSNLGLAGEVREAPWVLRANNHFGIGGLRFKADRTGDGEPSAPEGNSWLELLTDDTDLSEWPRTGESFWELDDDVLIGEGPAGYLFTPRADYRDFELQARVKISDGGNSGLFLRASQRPEGAHRPTGYEAQINSSFAEAQRTGSLYDLAPVKVQLVSQDTWFDYHLTCRDTADGTRVVVRINGVVINEYLDSAQLHASGHIAIEQHHEGSVIEISDLRVREL